MSEKGQNLDLTSSFGSLDRKNRTEAASKGFLGVHFACCDVYSRVYLNKEQTAYLGHCPRCAKQVRFIIGSGGTDSRFFKAY